MERLQYPKFHEELVQETLPNGLRVCVLPKKQYRGMYATFATPYGGNDCQFRLDDGTIINTPEGVAHFLEHKLFEEESGGDVFNRFAKQGASANAFTTPTRTTYLFSCTENFHKNLLTLLSFVQRPYFTDANVAKEQGIIGQEIRMYDDDPGWQVYLGLTSSLYHNHTVKGSIVGTVETISGITKEILYKCHETFYHPSNMVFFVAGPVVPEEVIALLKEHQAGCTFPPARKIEKLYPEEPDTVARPSYQTYSSVGIPTCLLGCKEAASQTRVVGEALLRRELLTDLALGAVLGSSSDLYQTLYAEGLLDSTFSFDYTLERGYGYALLGGQTKAPERLLPRVQQGLEEASSKGIDPAAFQRLQRQMIGSMLNSWNTLSQIVERHVSCQFLQADAFKAIDVLATLEPEEANERLRALYDPQRVATSTVLPEQA